MFRYGEWRVRRHTHHRHAPAIGRRQIDVIEAGRTERDEPRLLTVERLDDLSVHGVVDEKADGGKSGRQNARFAVQSRFEKRELVPMTRVGREKRGAVMRLRAEEDNLHRA